MTNTLHFYVTAVIFLVCGVCCADAQQCNSAHSTYGMMLRGFVFQESNTANIMSCGQLCYGNIRCQSINYVISRNLCELNSRTKEARPDNYVQDTDRIYVTRPSERGIVILVHNYLVAVSIKPNCQFGQLPSVRKRTARAPLPYSLIIKCGFFIEPKM